MCFGSFFTVAAAATLLVSRRTPVTNASMICGRKLKQSDHRAPWMLIYCGYFCANDLLTSPNIGRNFPTSIKHFPKENRHFRKRGTDTPSADLPRIFELIMGQPRRHVPAGSGL